MTKWVFDRENNPDKKTNRVTSKQTAVCFFIDSPRANASSYV